MQQYAVNFIPLLSSLYMFRAAHTPIIRSTTSHCLASLGESSRDDLCRYYGLYQVAVDTVKHCTPDDGHVCHPKHVE